MPLLVLVGLVFFLCAGVLKAVAKDYGSALGLAAVTAQGFIR